MGYYAIDFGTSNSLLNYVSETGVISSIKLDDDGSYILKSLLFTHEPNKWFYGSGAIENYIENDGEGRFFKSLKKFLPEPSYSGTDVHNKKMKIEDLIAVFMREMRNRANKQVGKNIEKVVLGRPALYDQNLENDALAEQRMRKAASLAGFKEIYFCPEPLAAGLDYDKQNKKEQIVLVADFGGGTSDFTLMKLHTGEYSQDDILGLSGIFKAGDAFDGQMMLDFISPHFGSKFEYKLPFGNNVLRFPRNLLKKMCSPAHITHLRERDTWEFLQEIQKFSIDEKSENQLDRLFSLVECQLGFPLFYEMEKSKIALCSSLDKSHSFHFNLHGVEITEEINQIDYQRSMDATVQSIMKSMMDVFTQSGLTPDDVDQVCLTGGTAQFTLIQDALKMTFGEEKIIQHNIYQSVVSGLSHYALRL